MPTCAIITSVLGCLATLILYARYTFIVQMPITCRIVIFFAAIVVGCIPLLITERIEPMLGKYYTLYSQVFYFFFIAAIILLTLTIIVDVIWGIGWLTFRSKMIALPSVLFLTVLSLIFSGWAVYEGTKIPVVKITDIISDKITQPVKIVFLSDLHIHRNINPKKIEGIVARVNSLKPDIVILGGDTIDDRLNKTNHVGSKLKKIQAPHKFFIAGNHEWYNGFQQSISYLKELGYTFLENTGETVKDIYIAGIPDMTTSAKSVRLKEAFKDAEESQYRVLLSHTPANFKEQNQFDLELSGHTHGGQIFPFHILTKLYNKYLSGLYTMQNNAQLYISRGSGQWGPQMRFLAPSEITVINLQPQSKGE